MAIQLECINVIIPINNLERCTAIGGFQGFLEINAALLGEIDWYDRFLYRTGAMNPLNIDDIVADLESYGLTPIVEKKGCRYWCDLCVVDSGRGLTLPCDWLEVDLATGCAWLKGTDRGEVIGRNPPDRSQWVPL